MKFCSKCVIPDTRPNITLNEKGVCNACESFASRANINWVEREKVFHGVVEHAKSRSNGYDCVIPVSGGKDSTWQVVTCLQYGLNPLAVTWKTPARTEIGQKNLDNLIALGVDHVDYQINPKVEKKFMYKALEKYGSTALPMHMAIFNIPLKIASQFGIPLIVWGENSAFEYGGKKEERTGFRLDNKFFEKYGLTYNTRAKDWVSEGFTERELAGYAGPQPDDLVQKNILAVFMGYYFPWDAQASLQAAQAHGFQVSQEGAKTGYYNYADIDDDFISIHHFLKWYKFGFTRLFDNLSLEIRNKRLTREKAVEIIRSAGAQIPYGDITKLCCYLNITVEHFFELIEKFRNHDIWSKDKGIWTIKNFLVDDFNWSEATPLKSAC